MSGARVLADIGLKMDKTRLLMRLAVNQYHLALNLLMMICFEQTSGKSGTEPVNDICPAGYLLLFVS
ncbi:hypothetical protein [Thalassotalea sp. PS06]|uniref:hypothetical protein n=1 Tax=Thalassotalea sp. PS06 TaxID=2594005 RepID=UPI0011642624|nr:hypothetical protein [Thalassotalea sp. PS06]QDP01409.1 hypothetical protein FNC98_08760 [Thalassotalea sp. PS06]